MAQIAVGCLGFASQTVGRTNSWAKLRAVQKKEQPLKKVRHRKRRWIREVQQVGKQSWEDQSVQGYRELYLENRRLERLRSGVWDSAV